MASGIRSRLRSARPDAGSSSDEDPIGSDIPRDALPSDDVRGFFIVVLAPREKSENSMLG